ncbi:nucleotide sugar dehydrogenase [Xylaria bambusicola]|uniref:nucleotide sugar dehydrogenase n=1 Tax=Xylaria bambusicola TaxID=326684 RepID=UPI002007D5E1|nr:nucleotide sugar dehydrogenase [Xylaria bambusicola]KAI0521995.1 nucleotide sugar dehydrogenase [Xylaria bambusicola]
MEGGVRNICFIGAGCVGGPAAAVIAYQNPQIRVVVVDQDKSRIRRWRSAHLPLYEPGLDYLVRVSRDGSREFSFLNQPGTTISSSTTAACESNPLQQDIRDEEQQNNRIAVQARHPNLLFTPKFEKSIKEADVIFVAVNTPTKLKGIGAGSATDMTAFEAATNTVARYAKPGAIIVEKSTMLMHRPSFGFEVLSNPEFLATGTAVNDLLHPSRVLIGHSKLPSGRRAAHTLRSIYASWVPNDRIITTDVWSSELSKIVANSLLAQRISSINSVSAICEKVGADVYEVAACVGSDPRIGDKYLQAGIGFGGSCLKKDLLSLVYLAESLQLDEVGDYWRQVIKMNEFQRDRFSKRVVRCLNNTLVGKKITLFGYTFKAGTSDTRDSPALEIIKSLLEENPREIAIFDPLCNPALIREEIEGLRKTCDTNLGLVEIIKIYDNPYKACAASNAVLITTECEEFQNTSVETNRPATAPKNELVDPRPLSTPKPTEQEVLRLHQFLMSVNPSSNLGDSDPLRRLIRPPPCANDCPDCGPQAHARSRCGDSDNYRSKNRLDWSKIVPLLAMPKWVFDGKGVIEPNSLIEIGVKVESIGRQGI